jgi:pilus assembly protein Flp/PilA
MRKILDFLKAEDGASMVEYALMLALIAAVCVAAVTTLGNNASNRFDGMATSVGTAS